MLRLDSSTATRRMSGGRRQRRHGARDRRRPRVFLDEQLLEPRRPRREMAELKQLHAELGVTMVYIRDQVQAAMADRIALSTAAWFNCGPPRGLRLAANRRRPSRQPAG